MEGGFEVKLVYSSVSTTTALDVDVCPVILMMSHMGQFLQDGNFGHFMSPLKKI